MMNNQYDEDSEGMENQNQNWSFWIPAILEAIYGAYIAWKGFRLLVFGTTGVGKSTLWKYLETGQIVNPSLVESTRVPTDLGDKFKLKDIAIYGIKVRIKAVDLPGDVELRSSWQAVLYTLKPQGIIFMVDHVKNTDSVPSLGFDQKRLEEHYEAFQYLKGLILNNAEVQKNLQALLVLVNKSDKFPKQLGYGDILKQSNIGTVLNSFNELDDLRTRATQCSALYGENIQEQITWLIKNLS